MLWVALKLSLQFRLGLGVVGQSFRAGQSHQSRQAGQIGRVGPERSLSDGTQRGRGFRLEQVGASVDGVDRLARRRFVGVFSGVLSICLGETADDGFNVGEKGLCIHSRLAVLSYNGKFTKAVASG